MTAERRLSRREVQRQRTEAEFLAVAAEVFAEFGYHGASTALIASRAGVPKANLHYYFSTKEALYRRVLEETMSGWLTAADPLDPAADPRQALLSYITDKLRWSRTRPDASRVWAREVMDGAPFIRAGLADRLLPWFARTVTVLEGWMAAGRLKPVDARHLLFQIWAATQHYADFSAQMQLYLGKPVLEEADYQAAAHLLAATLVDGLVK
jgi:TetR/AcrR family transcriptional regulator